jgi:hypothetical protein
LFHGPVRVPAEAKLGKVKVTFSLDAWKEGHVAPSTWEYTVVKAEPKPEDKKAAAKTNNQEKK